MVMKITVRPLVDGGNTSSDENSWWQSAPMADAASKPARSPYGDAISSIESGGRYDLLGPTTKSGDRAHGKYQVMGANVGPWTKEALGREMTPEEFLANPDAQEAVFNARFGSYVKKYGPAGAAKAWFAGEKGMNNPDARDILGTSVADYERKFNKAAGVDAMAYAPEDRPAPVRAAPADNAWWQAAPIAEPTKAAATPAIPPDPNPDVGRITALGEGARSGLLMNMGDELSGAAAAGMSGLPQGVQDAMPTLAKAVAVPIGVGRMIGEKIMGQDTASKAYETERDRVRTQSKAAQEQYPGTYIAGQIGGALAVPVGGMANAATLPARMARGAGLGAGIGGVSGAGEGENLTDRASRGTSGGVLGGVLGGVGAPVVEGLVQGGRAIAGPVITAVKGAINPKDEAARRVTTALARDANIDPSAVGRLTPAEYAASVQSGGPARILDIGGETTRALARSAANTSPEGRGLLTRSIDEAFEGQGTRIVNWLQNTFHFPNAYAQQQALEKSARVVNRENYGRAFIAGDRELMSPEIERLMGSPAFVEAMRSAATTGKDRAIAEGMGAFNAGVIVENGMVKFKPGKGGVPTYPNLQFWDATKRELDAAAKKLRRAGDDETAPVYENLARTLRTELDGMVPQYNAARAGAASGFGAENALDAGTNFVTMKMGNDEARALLGKMTPNERQLFQDGFVSEFIRKVTETGDRRNILNAIGESPAARERLKIALGPQKSAELEAGLRVEGVIDLARGAVTGNSTTARQLAELGFAGGAGSLGVSGAYNMDPTQMTYAAVAGALLAGKRGIDTRVAQRVAEMLVSNDPQMLLRGIKLVSNNNNMMISLRAVDKRLAVVSGEQVPSGATVQALGIGRAENDQPDVPRPSR